MDEPVVAALREIRAAEAARILGLLPAGGLVDRAEGWAAAGVTQPEIVRLATDATVSDPTALALLGQAAARLGLTFASTQEARKAYVDDVLPDLAGSPYVGSLTFTLSNNFTDELTRNTRGRLGRLFRRRRDRPAANPSDPEAGPRV
ncbi:hypothetical protein [Frondihabitans cladoniiphilus]|uniref:DUF222 domain-containing protein n=1 Tax=Frondihabitans cladoniiphilus TaxID=715785 RepID=A0ABP8WBF8_9MICO